MQASSLKILVERLPHAHDLPLPNCMTEGASGADVVAALDSPVTLRPGERALIPTGLKFEIPMGYEVQVRPRSGLAAKHGVTVLNTPGTIDADYRGEVKIILINLGNEPFTINRGERIAQLVTASVCSLTFNEHTDALSFTTRGDGGFGHTGVK
jgi:dUTP pyrophosphatase